MIRRSCSLFRWCMIFFAEVDSTSADHARGLGKWRKPSRQSRQDQERGTENIPR
jgi:hypothetical protein